MDLNDRCACPNPAELHKRVLYSHGLVLGVGELKTEQNYVLEQYYGHDRRLHGYGTVSGLGLEIRYLGGDAECVVHPGWAVDLQGHGICVSDAQCAKLNQWLAQQQEAGDLSSPFDVSGVASIDAYVLLCYRECETDKVPIPVGPCLSLDKAMVASRIADAFELKLATEPPAQAEEDAIRRLGDVLSRVSIATGPGGLTTPDALVAEIRGLLDVALDPSSVASTPADLVLDPAYAEEIVRAGLRVFVTELRPALVPDGGACLNGPRDQCCVLLGRLQFDFTKGLAGPQVVANSVAIDERRRPFLLSARVLQEAVLANMLPGLAGTSSAPLFTVPFGGSTPAPISALLGPLHPRAHATVAAPARAIVPAAAPTLLSLLPNAAAPIAATVSATLDGVPSLRFRQKGVAAFTLALPPQLPISARIRFRLHWAFTRPGAAEIALTWEAALALKSSNAALNAASDAGAPVSIKSQTPSASNARLISTPFVELPRGNAVDPVLAVLTLTLNVAAALPRDFEVHLLRVDVELAGGAL